VLRVLADNPGVKLCVEGHADRVEAEEGRVEALAAARAAAVHAALLAGGADAARLRAEGFGAACAGDGGAAGGARHNRRVTFSVIQEIRLGAAVPPPPYPPY
jgi:outer membrane protein OmpA-like peptidoglycan-associated protein